MNNFQGRIAVLTGAASGFGLEMARLGAQQGMKLVLADVQADALEHAAAELRRAGAEVLARRVDVSQAAEVEVLAAATREHFGVPHLVFNNAGVGAGGLVWETPASEWQWVLGVNLFGVAHGVRAFTPMMLEAASADSGYEGRIVNTASMAGLVTPPNMGVYNVSKHGVVALTETLYQDLALVTTQVRAHVLCPYFVPTGIVGSHRNRPADASSGSPTRSQIVAQAMMTKAGESGKVSAADVAAKVFDALREDRFYIYSHPHALASVQTRLDDVMQGRNPSDPFAERPALGEQLRAALRSVS
jgi:NAD(P)-dependent dehydrogenase (short-subunit alcohol dehydrogenase family)